MRHHRSIKAPNFRPLQPTGFYVQLGALALPAWWDNWPANILVHGDDILKATGIAPCLTPPYWDCREWAPSWNVLGYYRLNEIADAIASDDYALRVACESVTHLIHSTYHFPYDLEDPPHRKTITAALKNNGFIADMVPRHA